MEKYIKRSKEIGKAYAIGMFKDLTNEKYQGEDFKWENFPNLCGRISQVSLFISFTDKEWKTLTEEEKNKLKEITYKEAQIQAENLMKNMG